MANVDKGGMPERILKPNATPELGLLMQSFKWLLTEDSLGLCYNAGINFVGSLLVDLHSIKYARIIEEQGFTPSLDVILPVEQGCDFLIDGSKVRTGDVLFKRACGSMEVGVVLNGPLAGLITGEQDKTGKAKDRVIAVRVFNDEPIPTDAEQYHPYYPRFIDKVEPPYLKPGETNPVGDLKKLMNELFKQDYITYISKLRKKLGNPEKLFTSQVFFALCEDLGINVDRENFHLTIDQGEV